MECKRSISVDEYIVQVHADRHHMMQEIRNLIFETVPEVEETISQRMPSYKLFGKQLAYFANGKNHVGFFVDSKIVAANKDRLKEYVCCNSGFQLKLDKPLPLDIMREFLTLKMDEIKHLIKK